MRHKKRIVKLGRMSSHRKSMLSNMARSMVLYKKIYTTLPKAKAVVPLLDKLITWSKRGTLKDRQLAFSVLKDRTIVGKLFTEIAPLFSNRPGGYTRLIKADYRKGDGAKMAVLELVGAEPSEPKKK